MTYDLTDLTKLVKRDKRIKLVYAASTPELEELAASADLMRGCLETHVWRFLTAMDAPSDTMKALDRVIRSLQHYQASL